MIFPDAACSRLSDLVRLQAQQQPDEVAYIVLDRDGREASRTTYGQLDRWARSVGAVLQDHAAPGDRALLAFPTCADFLAALFGCAYAGIVAIPIPPPGEGAATSRIRMTGIIDDAKPAIVLTTPEIACQPDEYGLGGIRAMAVADLPCELADQFEETGQDPENLAFIQYTSGSTSEPKGVTVSHRNVLANLADIGNTIPVTVPEGDRLRCVSWLPLFHDMGLGQALFPMTLGGMTVLIPPVWFMVKPALWLEAITRYSAHGSTSPNFGYDLCARLMPEEKVRDLDLSEWRFALTGSEPVRAETLELFARTFAPARFDPAAFVPCYGLAEGAFFVSGARGAASQVTASAPALERESAVRPPAAGEPARRIVSCGPVSAALDVRIVDPATSRECQTGKVGEIWVSGDSVSAGYWRQKGGPFGARLADGPPKPYLRTGDSGFLHEGELYVLGRLDDVIVLHGRNHYPQDIELTAQRSHEALAPGRVAAFGYQRGAEVAVAIVAETSKRVRIAAPGTARVDPARGQMDGTEVVQAVRAAVSADHQIHVERVVLLRPAGLPRTTSGKVRRRRCRELFLADKLKAW
jgi:acyl-CoA synthetase (AMP-forming)/AMP-acid ligase II